MKDMIGQSHLNEERNGKELDLIWKGRALNEDLKTLKDIGMKPEGP
jgi:hypothetical protein